MTTIRIVLKSSGSKNGRFPVMLRVSDRGDREYFSTGFTATEKEFDGSKNGGRFLQGRGVRPFQVTRKEEDGSTKVYSNKDANDKLAELEARANHILDQFNAERVNWGLEQFRDAYTNAPKRTLFSEFASDVIERVYLSAGRFKKATIARDALNSFARYDKGFAKRPFQDINERYIQDYIVFARKSGNSDNTIAIRLREIRRFYNIAVSEKVATREQYPFNDGRENGKAKIPKTIPTRTDQYLPMESMKTMANAQLDDYILDRTRHLFLFSFYCRGMNWKDMAQLTVDNFHPDLVIDPETKEVREVKMLQYQRSKTEGVFRIQVTDNIQRELDWFARNTPLCEPYILPIISQPVPPEKLDEYLKQVRKRFNRSLKELAKVLKLPDSQRNLTIYSARHSFAMAMRNQDKPVEIISQALGHQSVETTKHYLEKFSTTRMAKETDIDLSM